MKPVFTGKNQVIASAKCLWETRIDPEKTPPSIERDTLELDFQTILGLSHQQWRGYADPECGKAYKRANELIGTVNDTARALPVVWGFWSYHLVAADHHLTIEAADHALAVAETSGDPDFLVHAYSINADTQFWLGNCRESMRFMELLSDIYDESRHGPQVWLCNHDAMNLGLLYAAHWLWVAGYPDQAVAAEIERYEQSHRLNHPYQTCFGNCWGSTCYQYRGERDALMQRVDEGAALAEENHFPMWSAGSEMFRGWWRAQSGDVKAGIEQFVRGLDQWRGTGSEIVVPWWHAQLGQLYALDGKVEQGLDVVDKGLDQAERWLEKSHLAELHRIKGDLLMAQKSPEPEAAVQAYQQALSVSRAQQAKGWELRAATSLARVWQFQNKSKEAYDLVSPVYDWFTEGFDTADLREAKVLLDELK